jgi:hypothetical protein
MVGRWLSTVLLSKLSKRVSQSTDSYDDDATQSCSDDVVDVDFVVFRTVVEQEGVNVAVQPGRNTK